MTQECHIYDIWHLGTSSSYYSLQSDFAWQELKKTTTICFCWSKNRDAEKENMLKVSKP